MILLLGFPTIVYLKCFFFIFYKMCLRTYLVSILKHMFSVFKQYYTYLYTLTTLLKFLYQTCLNVL